ncbi:hypothetical protein PG993_003059 [Apiospora rasikravindrae]|uniref:Uncharacterized protein n=1 Tax=Apiospora rasikravindrae TaxID=990691 RepID=A0ABR1TYF2_9PEZI
MLSALALLLSLAQLGMGSPPGGFCFDVKYDVMPNEGSFCIANPDDKLAIAIFREEDQRGCNPNRSYDFYVDVDYISVADGSKQNVQVEKREKVGDDWVGSLDFNTGIHYFSIKPETNVTINVHAENITYVGPQEKHHTFTWQGPSTGFPYTGEVSPPYCQ